MNESEIAKAIRSLTVAVWALVVVFIVGLILPFVWTIFAYGPFTSDVSSGSTSGGGGTAASMTMWEDEFNGFHEWPVEKQIANASAILVTRHTTGDAEPKNIISEILFLKPGTTLAYAVGDEFLPYGRPVDGSQLVGDGEIVFLTGSPPSFKYSTTYSGDECPGLDGLSIDALKILISEQHKEDEGK